MPIIKIQKIEDPSRRQYEEDLRQRQREHLDQIPSSYPGDHIPWRPCLHDGCPECVGTGIKKDGSMCVHHMSCPCPKCSPVCM